jgi:hypothetical protein
VGLQPVSGGRVASMPHAGLDQTALPIATPSGSNNNKATTGVEPVYAALQAAA